MRQFVDAKARALGIRVDHHMRVVIIGGTGHIGSFLTPRLVEAGHALTCVSRGMKQPYQVHRAWKAVTRLELDRTAEENAGTFGERIASLDSEVVIDLTCYRLESAKELVETLRGRIGHLLHCGTIWDAPGTTMLRGRLHAS